MLIDTAVTAEGVVPTVSVSVQVLVESLLVVTRIDLEFERKLSRVRPQMMTVCDPAFMADEAVNTS